MTVSKEYAQALFCLAQETNNTELYLDALKSVVSLIKENPKYMEFLACPSIAINERVTAIKKAFNDLPPHVLSFLCLLCEKGHITELFSVADEYNELYKEANRIISAEVISAVALSDDQKAKLTQKLEKLYNCKVNLTCSIDNSLLGGVTVKVDGKIVDSSIKHRLKSIKEVINR